MRWLTPFLTSFRSSRQRGGSEPERRATPQRPPRRLRRRPLVIEALEDRLCLSIDLLVSSAFNHSVMRYNGTTGAFLGAFVTPEYGGLLNSHGLAIGFDGHLLISSVDNSSVLRYDSTTGVFLGAFVPEGSGGLARPVDLAFGPDGNLYVSSAETRSILRYDRLTGAFLNAFVPTGSGGLARPHGTVFGPDGHLYVNSHETHSVMRYHGTTGAPLPAPGRTGAYFVATGSGGLDTPWGDLVFGPDGNLYVSAYWNSTILRYDATTGDFLGAFVPTGSGGLSHAVGLDFGPDGNLYVVSQATNSVLRYDGSTGAFLDAFVPGGGQLSAPTYLFFWDTSLQLAVSAPASVPAGIPFDVTVTVLDAYGHTVRGYRGTVAFWSSDAAATLPGPYRFRPQDNGVALFPGGVTLRTLGTQYLAAYDVADFSVVGYAAIDVSAPDGAPGAGGGPLGEAAFLTDLVAALQGRKGWSSLQLGREDLGLD